MKFVWRFRLACALIALSAAAVPLTAQQAAHHSMGGPVPEEILSRPVSLRSGIGVMHQKVSTSSKQAQAFYDQGLAYLQSYVWIEAARSFHQALRSDPKMVMAYVGLSYAYSPFDFAAAESNLNQAQALASHASDRERRRIQIRALQLRA